MFFRSGVRGCGGRAWHPAAFVRVDAVVPDGLLAPGWDVVDGGGKEIGGFEDFKVALGFPTAPGAVDDGQGVRIPLDFLEGERSTQKIFSKALAALGVAWADGFFAGVDVEAAVFPRKELGDF